MVAGFNFDRLCRTTVNISGVRAKKKNHYFLTTSPTNNIRKKTSGFFNIFICFLKCIITISQWFNLFYRLRLYDGYCVSKARRVQGV